MDPSLSNFETYTMAIYTVFRTPLDGSSTYAKNPESRFADRSFRPSPLQPMEQPKPRVPTAEITGCINDGPGIRQAQGP